MKAVPVDRIIIILTTTWIFGLHAQIFNTTDVISDKLPTLKERIISRKEYRKLHCNGSYIAENKKIDLDNDKYIEYDSKQSVLRINRCQPLPIPYSDVVNEIGIDSSMIHKAEVIIELAWKFTEEIEGYRPDLNVKSFKHLPLNNLTLIYRNKEATIGRPRTGFLAPLTNMSQLTISNALLPPMPKESNIQTIYLSMGASFGQFGGCKKLSNLKLDQWQVLRTYWLSSCPKLTVLTMDSMFASSVYRALRGASSLMNVSITNCRIFILPEDIFNGMKNLKVLDLSHNYLKEITLNANLPSLSTFILSDNEMEHKIMELLDNLPNLETLNATSNAKLDFCLTFMKNNNTAVYPKLKTLDLTNTATALQCISATKFPVVEKVYINYHNDSMLKLQNILSWQVPLELNLGYNIINDVEFTESDYAELYKSKPNIKIIGKMSLKCDCQQAYFAQALREHLLTFPSDENKVLCEDMDNVHLSRTSPHQTECSRSQCEGCVCRRKWSDNGTEADCRGATNVITIPEVQGLQKLLAPNNRIQLRKDSCFQYSLVGIPDSLTYLDLSQNNIWSVEEDIVRKLFSVKNRKILLSGNPIECNCKNRYFIEAIQTHKGQVLDFENVTCDGIEKKPLRDVNVNELCNDPFKAALGFCSALLALIMLGIMLNYHFGQEIRVFMYARGWCLSCLRDDDDDRIYDAFVSFCYADEALISQEFVPKLEKYGYKICVHYRDWIPGDLIPTQIVRSIEASRKTIIILSKHFAYSSWGSLEFRAAHARALKEGIARVILIVLDDIISSENLDKDIRSYIRTNTYVTWNDPWLWDKLRYAMRRRRARQNCIISRTAGIDITPPGLPKIIITSPTGTL